MRSSRITLFTISCIILCMLLSVFLNADVHASEVTLDSLKVKFPHGAYWNHVTTIDHGFSEDEDYDSCNNPDRYTWNPCYSHSENVPIGQYSCNNFQNTYQSCGFVKKLAYDVYGSTHSSWETTTINQAKPGDVIHYFGGGADETLGHWAMIVGKNGRTLTIGETEVDDSCKISWGRALSVDAVKSYVIYSAPYILPMDTTVVYSNFRYENLTESSVTIYADVYNPGNFKVTDVGFKLYDEELNLLVEGSNAITPYADTNGWQSQSISNLAVGTTYCYQFYLIADGNVYYSDVVTMQTKGLMGDVDLNGLVEANDALVVLKSVVKLSELNSSQWNLADVNADGEVTAEDALLILKKVVRLIDKFPAELH